MSKFRLDRKNSIICNFLRLPEVRISLFCLILSVMGLLSRWKKASAVGTIASILAIALRSRVWIREAIHRALESCVAIQQQVHFPLDSPSNLIVGIASLETRRDRRE